MKHFKTKFIIIIATIVSLVAITIGVYAYISRISARGEINVSAATINAETTYTSSTNSFDWTYTKAGDIKEINITTNNQTGIILHRYYNIQLASGFTSNENLLKATIVYYNNKYIGTLNDIVNSNNLKIEEKYNFIGLASNKTDGFKFELHQAAKNSILDNKDVKVTITTFTENADYYKYIFVKSEADFKKAIDDMNSGMLSETPTIVLCNNITLTNNYTISEPTTIYMNGSTLNGDLTINDTTEADPNALLEVLGEGAFNATVTLGANYDHEGAVNLVKNHVKDVLKDGVSAGSTTNILGHYAFYGISVSAITRCTFTSPNIEVQNSSNEYYNALGAVKVHNDEIINFKILGSKTELIDGTLAHLPQNRTISLDLFLPTYIPSQNASITWKSSDESIITNTGKITAKRLENAAVTLYAEIRVNEKIFTRTFNFKVSAHNNEINFYKLVQEISPIVISNVRNSQADDDDALYHLPIVSENNGVYGTYDYRTSYISPVNTKLFNWVAYRNIGLESITYEQQKKFDYITLENSNELYLNNITLNNYASITITGDFGNEEKYSTSINISISVGSNTQLLEKTFSQISDELSQISILGNILSTRIQNGMANEKGDFSLSTRYLDQKTNQLSEDYSVEYSGKSNIITSITKNEETGKYDFSINPEYFNEYETTVAFTATVYYRKEQKGETHKDRTFYITVPAALHIKDFGTISIYNATKYQVFNQLPAGEKTGTTGYTVSGSSLTDSNLDYILLRDIVGDANYLAQYNHNNTSYLEKINYTSSNYASGTESLSYLTSSTNPTSTTDTLAYDFARLIEWATGDTRATASSVVSNTNALGTYASTKANAEAYLNNKEIAVLRQYYQYCTKASDSEWESLFNEVFNVAPGYIYTNPALLNEVIKALGDKSISSTSRNYATYFGKYMEILQRYAVSTTKVNDNDVAPCQEQYNTSYLWYHSNQAELNEFKAIASNDQEYTSKVDYIYQLVDGSYWYRGNWPDDVKGSGGDGSLTGFYATKAFAADRTSYITAAELQVIMMFWLNVSASDKDTSISSENKISIQSVLNQNIEYYEGYSISNFDTVYHSILNAFAACMEIPTYFSTDGVSKIIKSFYDVPSYDGTSNASFVSSLNGNVPYITNGDNIKSVLSYFINLKSLTFNGNDNLAVFLSENGLSTVFARTGLYNTEITSLTMKHVAHKSVNFDLTNIKNFKNLKVLDLSNNTGIQSVNELVNVNRSNYTSVNIENIGVEAEYQEFAIDNIASSKCTVNYTNALGANTYSNDSSRASKLADLSDFNKFITKYMYMTNVLYDKDGNTTTVTWRIDEGNEINGALIQNGGNYPSISTIDEMNQLISPYYYCTQSFTYTNTTPSINFVSNHLYGVYYEGRVKAHDLGVCENVNDVSNLINLDFGISEPDDYPENEIFTSTNVTDAGSITYSDRTDIISDGTGYYETKTGSVDYSEYTYNNGDCQTQYTLPTMSTLISYIQNQFSSDNPYDIEISATIEITTKNNDGYNNGDTNNGWQHGLLNSERNLISYSPGLVLGGNTYTHKISQDYLSQIIYVRFYNSNGVTNKASSSNLYPNGSFSWEMSTLQYLYSINIIIDYSYKYAVGSRVTINYKDGNTENINDSYACGWRIKKLLGKTIEYTETERTTVDFKFYYDNSQIVYYNGANTIITDSDGNNVNIKNGTMLYVVPYYYYPVSERSRTYRIVSDIYFWEFWYCIDNSQYSNFISQNQSFYPENNKQTRAGELIDSIVINGVTYYASDFDKEVNKRYQNSTIRTNVSGFDVDWKLVDLRSSWQLKVNASEYITYVGIINNMGNSLLNTQAKFYDLVTKVNIVYGYVGTTGSKSFYVKGATDTGSFKKNYCYKLIVSNNQLAWQQYSTDINNPTGTTMDSILAEANTHFSDYRYGEYYGKYYGYSGSNFYSSLGRYYDTGYVYRIMPNESNTEFTWKKVSRYTSATADNILKSLGTGGLDVDAYCYATKGAGFGFFDGPQWYKVVLDEKTNIVNLVKFNDVGLLTDDVQTYTRLINDKLVPKSIGDGQDYLGYSGTFTIRISAMIRTYNSSTGTWTEYIKTYKLKFVGSLTS